MTAENFTNFATSALNGAITSATATSFSVTGGQGALFPTATFVVSIDSELLLVTSRSGDTFTVLTRGFNGTTAATHTTATSVVLPICAYNLQHLWQNVADTYTPVVPPSQSGGNASAYDNEFESAGTWSLYPSSVGGGTVFNAGFTLASHLLLARATGDNSLYTAYIAFAPGTNPWTATCKLSESTQLLVTNNDQAQTSFFVSDLPNPTNGADTGNRFKVNTALVNSYPFRVIRAIRDTSGAASFLGTAGSGIFIPTSPCWLRITCNGAGTYQAAFSQDGVTYWLLAQITGLSFTAASLGLTFHFYNPSGQWVSHQAAVDYVRVAYGTVLPLYGG